MNSNQWRMEERIQEMQIDIQNGRMPSEMHSRSLVGWIIAMAVLILIAVAITVI
ncbi:MAG: hypothetical protein AB7P33_18980 [Dehalococcoidia bacterium]